MIDQAKEGLLSPLLQSIRNHAVAKYVSGQVLDFGCGNGNIIKLIKVDEYIGYDISSEIIERNKKTMKQGTFIKEIPKNRTFDTILLLAVIEHLAKPLETLIQLKKMLAKGGKIIITSPNPLFMKLHALGSRIGFFSKEAHQEHKMFVNKESMGKIAKDISLDMVKATTFFFGTNQLFILRN